MKRKVIQIANSTQLISLPRRWAQKYGVKKGDEIEVEEDGNKIVISTERTQDAGNIEVDITGLDRDSFMFLIRTLYIRGYDEIKLNFTNQIADHHRLGKKIKVISEIHTEVNRLTGIEVIQQKENFCVLKVLSESSVKDFDLILRRIFLLLTDASADLARGATKSDRYLVESLEEKHNTITKFMANALRLLNKGGYPDYKKIALLYHIIESLDNINDILKESARDIVNSKIVISKSCDNFLQLINTSIHDYYDLFYKFDFKLVEKLSSDRYKILNNVKMLSKKLNKDEMRVLLNQARVVDAIYTLKVTRMAMEY
ncbi:AbrB/MazE/SpoVT family DNA-binding domain-containing protein [Candidatus Woesearchaeota archaeon]|nr:AbrB/MazE/SpoVT family DNA-binding domain-containing protein [Candidatus Woesearchaeota archaeon]